MKWFLLCCCTLTFSLAGCQYLPSSMRSEEQSEVAPEPDVYEQEHTIMYGANFAIQYNKNPDQTCLKYKQLFEQGYWRAGWVLALHVNETNTQSCLSRAEAVVMLETLESEKKINSEFIWITQNHLRVLQKLQQATKNMGKLKRSVRLYKKKVTELDALNQEQLEKLEALKAIATSINNH